MQHTSSASGDKVQHIVQETRVSQEQEQEPSLLGLEEYQPLRGHVDIEKGCVSSCMCVRLCLCVCVCV